MELWVKNPGKVPKKQSKEMVFFVELVEFRSKPPIFEKDAWQMMKFSANNQEHPWDWYVYLHLSCLKNHHLV